MTIAQIHKAAAERYPLKGCRLERMQVRRLKARYIERMIEKYGLNKGQKVVNS